MPSHATVNTLYGSLYLKRLCRHFSHKVPATFNQSKGRIEFHFAVCRIEVDDQHMHLTIDGTNSPGDIERAENVIADHLVRMANKDAPQVTWNRGKDT